MKTLLVALLLAAPTAPAVRAEIDQLLGRLESSACRFNRNGSWHPAAEAKKTEKEITDRRKQLASIQAKLSNSSFTERAPAEVVQKQKDDAADLEAQINTLEVNLAELRAG